MEAKTKVRAEEGRQELFITRRFDLPVALLFKAYSDAELLEQWMGTKVLKLDNQPHGSYRFETTDPRGFRYGFNGTIHQFEEGRQIVRTFEMEGMDFGVQLEFLRFTAVDEDTSQLDIHTLFGTADQRDRMVKMGMEPGINMAHERLQRIAEKQKQTYEQAQ